MVKQRLHGRRVAGDHDSTLQRVEPVADGIDHLPMLHGEGVNLDIAVPMDDAWRNLLHVHFATMRIVVSDAVDPPIYVNLPGIEYVLGHGLDSFGTIDIERLCVCYTGLCDHMA